MKLFKDGTHSEMYNGPGKLAFENAGKPQKTSQRSISLSKLQLLMDQVPMEQQLPRVRRRR